MKKEYIARIGVIGATREFKVSDIAINDETVSFNILGNNYSVTLQAVPTQAGEQLGQHTAARSNSPAARPTAAQPATRASTTPGSLIAPISGVVVSINTAVGATVEVGQVIAVLEAMKMENPIKSDRAGIVKAIHAAAGAQVRTGEAIISFEQ